MTKIKSTKGQTTTYKTYIYNSSTSDTRRVNLTTNPVISHEWGQDRKCWRQMEHIRGDLWHRYSIKVKQFMVATVKLSKWWLQLS